MSTQEVKDMFDWINSVDLYSNTPSIQTLGYIDGFVFQRPETAESSDPYVISREIEYKPSLNATSLPFWKHELSSSQSENGTLIYSVFQDTSDVNTLQTLEVYKSRAYFKDIHSGGQAATENRENMENSTVQVIETVMEQKGGFLFKAM